MSADGESWRAGGLDCFNVYNTEGILCLARRQEEAVPREKHFVSNRLREFQREEYFQTDLHSVEGLPQAIRAPRFSLPHQT